MTSGQGFALAQASKITVKIQLVTPAPLRLNNGNKITAIRWAEVFRRLGHRVRVTQSYDGRPCDVIITLHARRSHESIQRFHDLHPELPLIVVLTGTDLYRDIHHDPKAKQSLELATRLVALQRMAYRELPKRFHVKTRVIYQSAPVYVVKPPRHNPAPFKVCVIGHLRGEKDPLRTARAVRRLPRDSDIQVTHVGQALDKSLERIAKAEVARNPRYRWIGQLSHAKTREILAQSHLVCITSKMEGSSNVLSEALASGVPVIASRISGLIGTLGEDYPGYFPTGRTQELAKLLQKAETDGRFYKALKRHCAALKKLVAPHRELQAWKSLLGELS
jgi:putative glycosyltransferase (TIGR04348 family)